MATIATEFSEPLAAGQTFDQPEDPLPVQRIAQLFFATFWLIVFTGSIRKWAFPGTNVFYLLQDVPMTMAYVYALYKGYFTRGVLFVGLIFFSAILVFQTLMQVVLIDLSPIVAFVGLHHYLYYAFMMLVFPLGLTPKYRRNFVLWNLWAALPMLPLSLAQALAPPSAFINKSTMGDSFSLPGVDVARISGPFNFTAAYGLWVGIAFGLCLGEWLLPVGRRASRSRILLISATAIWALIALISGSRENVVICAAAAGGAAIGAVQIRSMRTVAIVALGVFAVPVGIALVYVINPTEFETMKMRFTGKEYSANLQGRMGENLYGWVYEPEFSFIGKGVGMGIDAAHFGSADAYNFTYGLAESDTVRNVIELGTPVGYLWNFTRMAFALGMIVFAVRLTFISPHCLPLACLSFAQVVWDLTRYATTSYTQVMLAYSFIFGASIYPYFFEPKSSAPELMPGDDHAPLTAA